MRNACFGDLTCDFWVDLVHQSEFTNDKSILHDILGLTNMASKTGNLMLFLPLHLGLKVKVTKKLLPPEIVQCVRPRWSPFNFIPMSALASLAHPPVVVSWRDRIRLDMFAWTISLP